MCERCSVGLCEYEVVKDSDGEEATACTEFNDGFHCEIDKKGDTPEAGKHFRHYDFDRERWAPK